MRDISLGLRLVVFAILIAVIVAAGATLFSTPSGATPVNTVTISGQAFRDVNGNAIKDAGDNGLSGWTIFIDGNNNGKLDSGELSTTTDSQGNYSFTSPAPSAGSVTVKVREVVQGGWMQTTNNPADITVTTAGGTFAGRDFGNFQKISISGQVFNDLNGDGSKGAGDSGIQGWTVFLDSNNDGLLDNGEASLLTDAGGNYSFTNLGPGSYRVREVTPAAWTRTTSNPLDITAGSGTNVDASINPGLNFGNFQLITVSGTVYNDLDGFGSRDVGEPGLAGWTVMLDVNGSSLFYSTITDAQGNYSIAGLGPGSYRAHVQSQSGWTQTTANPTVIVASSGANVTPANNPGLNFGNFQAATISGKVFEDFNNNGLIDPGEPGLAGRTVFIDANQNNVLDAGEITTTTDANGNYSFTNLGPGSYLVTLAPTAGWDFAGTISLLMQAVSGTNQTLNFGSLPQFVVTNTNSVYAGSLRQAITDANAVAGTNVINISFAIPGAGVHTIAPTTPLPAITHPVSIDGTTQPGYAGSPIIELNGAGAGNLASGIVVSAGNSTVKGLVINRFALYGIAMDTKGGNVIANNYIGTDVSGATALGNRFGVLIDGVTHNTIGGAAASARNVISGNTEDGIQIGKAVQGSLTANVNIVEGNYIGTDATGTIALGNKLDGLRVSGSNSNTIGGALVNLRNVISGNGYNGIEIFGGAGNQILGNYIGTDTTGTISLGNAKSGPLSGGILIYGSVGNTVGGTTIEARNVISGSVNSSTSTGFGVRIGLSGLGFATGNVVLGNYIGTDATGTTAVPNVDGVILDGSASNNTIGGIVAGAGNLISANTIGIDVVGNHNSIQGNLIGTDKNGTAELSNSDHGIAIEEGTANLIGGTTGAARNIISGNNGSGILFMLANATANTVQGNYIGTDITGTVALGNKRHGIVINGSNNLIGGTDAGTANVISGNLIDGVLLQGSGGTGNFVVGNFIGTKADGVSSLGNHNAGVEMFAPAGSNTVANNTIAFNSVGVSINNNSAGNAILSNSIFNNSSLGIDLAPAGVTPNDPGDVDSGPNNLQNFPQLSFANQTGSGLGVGGSLNSTPNTTFRIEFFANSSCDSSGNGEGKTFVGTGNVTTDATGNAFINTNLTPGFDTFGMVITSTATRLDAQGNPTDTSEFSACLRVPFADLSVTGLASNNIVRAGDNLTYNLTVKNNGPDISTNVSLSDQLPSATTLVSCTASAGVCSNFTLGNVTAGLGNLASGAQVTITIIVKVDNAAAGQLTDHASVFATSVFDPTQTNNSLTIKTDVMALPVIQFSQSNYAVAERAGTIQINVARSGDTSTPVSVDYATDDGSVPSVAVPCSAVNGAALERCDYTRSAGTLFFAAGETQKSFTVLVNDDSYAEGAENLQLVLSNPAGATLGQQVTATLQITDDSPESSGNPIDDPSFFVRQHYHDFLNREADQPGLDFWTSSMTSCGSDQNCRDVRRINNSAAFFLSIEFQQTGYLVERLYKVSYGDATGNSNFANPHTLPVPVVRLREFLRDTQQIGQGVVVGSPGWDQQLETNKQLFAAAFVSRQRFIDAFPVTLNAQQFVTQLDQNAGQVLTDAEKLQLEAIFGGPSALSNDPAKRAQVVRAVAENSILQQRESNRAFVLMQFFGYLRRNPNDAQDTDYSGFDFWLMKLNQFNGDFIQAEMVKAFISSTEYRQRFASQ